jgi:hypothetical protein
VSVIRELIEARGAMLLYLPPYSPDLNPIELLFAKLKRLRIRPAEPSGDRRSRALASGWLAAPLFGVALHRLSESVGVRISGIEVAADPLQSLVVFLMVGPGRWWPSAGRAVHVPCITLRPRA